MEVYKVLSYFGMLFMYMYSYSGFLFYSFKKNAQKID